MGRQNPSAEMCIRDRPSLSQWTTAGRPLRSAAGPWITPAGSLRRWWPSAICSPSPSSSPRSRSKGQQETVCPVLSLIHILLAIMQLRTGNPGGLLLSFAFSALFSTSMQFPLQKAAGRGRRAVPHRRPSVPIRRRRLLRRQICSCAAWDTSSSRKSGWAREISCSARCQEDSPFRLAIPYSVTT